MYVLYLDESGGENDPTDRFFVLGGLAVFERTTYFLSQSLESLQTKYFPNVQPVVFHSTDIRGGKGFWRKQPKELRESFLHDMVTVLATSNSPGVVLFAAGIEKNSVLYGEEAVKRATEEVCRRFDIFLMRRANEYNDPQRGLIVFAEGKYHLRGRIWVRGFRRFGTQWGVVKNLADIPYFADMPENRLLQAADLVAHAVFLAFERQDFSLVKPLLSRFDSKDGVIHGLVHVSDTKAGCSRAACASRKSPGSSGSWG